MVICAISAWTIGSPGQIMVKTLECASRRGHEVHVFAQKKDGYETSWIPNYHRMGSKLGLRIHVRLATDTGLHGCFSFFSTLRLIWELEKINPDIVHLHNLHGWFLNLPLFFWWLKRRKKCVLWTLHDCWSFTGHCPHFVAEHCNRWMTGCHTCPRYREYPASRVDQSQLMWRIKRRCFTGIENLAIVTPSEWLAALVTQSFLKQYPVHVINNGIDLGVFRPTQSNFRQKHNLEGKYLILGVSFSWGYKKGLDVFKKLRQKLDESYEIVLVGFEDNEKNKNGFIAIQKTDSKEELAAIYSAADVFVNPTREDTFPTVNIEALACGTPVITFPTGGSSEIIDETCGIVTKAATSDAILEAVQHMRTHVDRYTEAACCNRAKRFDQNVCYDAYVALYEEEVKNVGKNEYT